jgi:predicted DNA-binding protein YlxM (UPF0122 family)
MVDAGTSFEKVEYSEEIAEIATEGVASIPEAIDQPAEKKIYTKADLLEVISFLVCLDQTTLSILNAKFGNPDVQFSEIAREQGVSRQAIHKLVLSRCEEIPELEPLLRNRKRMMECEHLRIKAEADKAESNFIPLQTKPKAVSFKEAVCQIRKKMSEERLKKLSNVSESSKRLTSLTQRLDLSRLSIFSTARRFQTN